MKGKSRWLLQEGQEYSVFCLADDGWWYCGTSGCLFAIVDNASIQVGDSGERLAVFVMPDNAADPFHGFPVFSSERKPAPELLDQWQGGGVIDYGVRIKIEKGRL